MNWPNIRIFVVSTLLTSTLTLIWFQQSTAANSTPADFATANFNASALEITALSPAARSLTAPVDSSLSLQFNQPLSTSTVLSSTLRVFGRWSGPAPGSFAFTDLGTTVLFTPTTPFSAGEQVMVILSDQIQAEDGTPLANGYAYQFWTASATSELAFETIDVLDVRDSSGAHTQAYGGVATDFNNDGWLDISIVNEVTADIRVFLNKADGSGLTDDFLQPPTAVGSFASPSEPADFDRDGQADLAVANILDGTISILLGQGDGTFAPQQVVTVGSQPRGIAVLDADGDGDPNIVNTNRLSNNLSLLLNDGSGLFGTATFFEGGGSFEWALAAADMNEDGRLDLVIGTDNGANSEVLISLGNGDGTFTFASSQAAGGHVWMLNASDVNGDGHDDVVTANSSANNGAVLLGDGNGNLGAPTLVPTDPFPLATDVGDIDGDGDLDWITSSYNGDWLLFLNNGQGDFAQARAFNASQAASCALMLDSDNNGTLDLALIDEIADEVILVQNRPEAPQIIISPVAISETLPSGTAVTRSLTISNTGSAALSWQVHESDCQAPVDVSWLSASPLTGTTPAAATAPVQVTLSAVGQSGGLYQANLCIASNDPAAAATLIPVEMFVFGTQWRLFLPAVTRP